MAITLSFLKPISQNNVENIELQILPENDFLTHFEHRLNTATTKYPIFVSDLPSPAPVKAP